MISPDPKEHLHSLLGIISPDPKEHLHSLLGIISPDPKEHLHSLLQPGSAHCAVLTMLPSGLSLCK
uniref:Uncharacterized protein n=1 Tax=Anguilla anguilla TaxID=7936 RepID=A0A0E9PCB6_ANGAN